MAPMRPHNKSRNGCKTCRKRKVKCDETSPVCSNCAKREIECIWNDSPREPSSAPATVERSPSVYQPPPPAPLDVPPPRLDFMTLELMHHFTNHACYTIYDHSDTIEIWKSVVPDMAFSTNCAFLLHSVLAFSALHLHHLHQAHPNASKYFYAAASHYNQALKTIPAYPDSSSDDNHILYPTHTLISMYGFATSECVYAQSDWIDMVRTTPTSRYDGYRTSPLAPLMRALATTYTAISAQLQIDLTGPSLFPPSLSYLHLPTPGAPNADEVRDPVIADTYQKAIFHLRRTWVASLHPEFRCYAAFIFLVSAPDLFFTLLWEQRPRALIIAGHYCAILRRMKGQWWTKRDWSAQIERIMAAVGDQWRAWFDWVSEVEQVRTFETYQDNSALYTWMPS